MRSADSRGHIVSVEYDILQRPIKTTLSVLQNPEKLIAKTLYGTDKALNLNGKVHKQYDQSGISTVESYDFKGNPLQTLKQFAEDFQNYIDWNETVNLHVSEFTNSFFYDALNRPVAQTKPDQSTVYNIFNKAGLLEKIVRELPDATTQEFVTNVNYNARGQRTDIYYGNQSKTSYTYNSKNFRLTRLLSTRNTGSDILQDINYTYDPEGNITEIFDNAEQPLYFNGSVIEPKSTYKYDALYRLIEATGREHNSLANLSNNDFANNIIRPEDGTNMRNYTQTYQYDEIGNIIKMKSDNVWTRDYRYDFTQNNYLLGHDLESITPEYLYDSHGNMTKMPHLQELKYDFTDNLKQVTLDTSGNAAYYVYDSNGEQVRKVVVKTNITETRFYLGDYEYFTKTVNGVLSEETQTLHINDDKSKVAIVNSPFEGGQGDVIRYQLTNHLGSASLELDQTSEIITYEEYHPFGTSSYRSGRNEIDVSLKRYKYVFKELDNETGLYYYGMRYYAAPLARFVSVDPLQFKYPFYTPFQYAGNKPVSFIDLDGAEPATNIENRMSKKASRVFDKTIKVATENEIFNKIYNQIYSSDNHYIISNSKMDGYIAGMNLNMGDTYVMVNEELQEFDPSLNKEEANYSPVNELGAQLNFNTEVFEGYRKAKKFYKNQDDQQKKLKRSDWKNVLLETVIEEFVHIYQYETYTENNINKAYWKNIPGLIDYEFETKVVTYAIVENLILKSDFSIYDKEIKSEGIEINQGKGHEYFMRKERSEDMGGYIIGAMMKLITLPEGQV